MKNASQIILAKERIRGHLIEVHLMARAKVNSIELECWINAYGTAGEGTEGDALLGANFKVAAWLELLVNQPKELGVFYTCSNGVIRYRQKMTTACLCRTASRSQLGINERNHLFCWLHKNLSGPS